MTKFNISVMLFYAVFLLFIFNYYGGKIEKQNEKIEIMKQNDEELKKLIDRNINIESGYKELFCEFHFCDKSEENLISKGIY